MPTQTFYIEGKYMGEANRAIHKDASGISYYPTSLAFFCTKCGDTWARIVVNKSDFRVEYGDCRKHEVDSLRISGERPGSLYRPWLSYLVDDLPIEVIRREFNLHLKYYERETK